MLNHEHTDVFGSCNISATSQTVGLHSANVGQKNVLSPTAKLISDWLIESEIDITVEIHTGPSHSRAALDTDWLEVREKAEFVFIELKRPSVAIVYSD